MWVDYIMNFQIGVAERLKLIQRKLDDLTLNCDPMTLFIHSSTLTLGSINWHNCESSNCE